MTAANSQQTSGQGASTPSWMDSLMDRARQENERILQEFTTQRSANAPGASSNQSTSDIGTNKSTSGDAATVPWPNISTQEVKFTSFILFLISGALELGLGIMNSQAWFQNDSSSLALTYIAIMIALAHLIQSVVLLARMDVNEGWILCIVGVKLILTMMHVVVVAVYEAQVDLSSFLIMYFVTWAWSDALGTYHTLDFRGRN